MGERRDRQRRGIGRKAACEVRGWGTNTIFFILGHDYGQVQSPVALQAHGVGHIMVYDLQSVVFGLFYHDDYFWFTVHVDYEQNTIAPSGHGRGWWRIANR